MDESFTQTFSSNDREKIDLILSVLEQLAQDLHLAKCEIKTAIREVSLHNNFLKELFLKFHSDFREIDARLHGIELRQQRENSST